MRCKSLRRQWDVAAQSSNEFPLLDPRIRPHAFWDSQGSCISSFTLKRLPFQHSHIEEVSACRYCDGGDRDHHTPFRLCFSHNFFGDQTLMIPHHLHCVRCVSSHCFETWNYLASESSLLLLRLRYLTQNFRTFLLLHQSPSLRPNSFPKSTHFSKSHCCRKNKQTDSEKGAYFYIDIISL